MEKIMSAASINGALVVTFAWSFALALLILHRLFFRCPHKWELVDKTQLPSKIEELCKHWRPQIMHMDELLKVAKINATVVVRCDKCGHCKIIRMSNE